MFNEGSDGGRLRKTSTQNCSKTEIDRNPDQSRGENPRDPKGCVEKNHGGVLGRKQKTLLPRIIATPDVLGYKNVLEQQMRDWASPVPLQTNGKVESIIIFCCSSHMITPGTTARPRRAGEAVMLDGAGRRVLMKSWKP